MPTTPRTHDASGAQASAINEENPPTVPEGIAVRDMARVKYRAARRQRGAHASPAVREAGPHTGASARAPKVSTGTSSTTCRRRCCPPLVGVMSNDPAAGVHRLAVGVDVRSRTISRARCDSRAQGRGHRTYRVIFLRPVRDVGGNATSQPPPASRVAGTGRHQGRDALLAPLRRAADEVVASTMSVTI